MSKASPLLCTRADTYTENGKEASEYELLSDTEGVSGDILTTPSMGLGDNSTAGWVHGVVVALIVNL